MPQEGNKAVVIRLFDEFYNCGNMGAADELMAARVIDHSPQEGQLPGLEGVKKAFAKTRVGMPDARSSIEDVIAEGDKVAVRWNLTGTTSGEIGAVISTKS